MLKQLNVGKNLHISTFHVVIEFVFFLFIQPFWPVWHTVRHIRYAYTIFACVIHLSSIYLCIMVLFTQMLNRGLLLLNVLCELQMLNKSGGSTSETQSGVLTALDQASIWSNIVVDAVTCWLQTTTWRPKAAGRSLLLSRTLPAGNI